MSTLLQPDGRTTSWAEYGSADGVPVVVLHGTPGSRFQAVPLDEPARRLGARLIAVERPGFGRSDPAPGRGFADLADDLRPVLDVCGVGRVSLLAMSGGSAFALAVAARLPERVGRVAVVSGAGLAQRRGLQDRLVLQAPGLAERILRSTLEPGGRKGLARRLAERRASEADRAAAADPAVLAWLEDERRERVAHGVRPALDELRRYAEPWGFDLADVRARVDVVHGSADRSVPLERARALAEALPDGHLRVVEGGGHGLLVQAPEEAERVLAALVAGGRT